MIAETVWKPAEAGTTPHGQPSILIRKAAVLGAGTMGSRIAAHLANAGLPVVLLDIPAAGRPTQRNRGAGARRAQEEQTGGVLRPGLCRADLDRQFR